MSRDQAYGKQSTLEVSESAFEYLLGELIRMKPRPQEDAIESLTSQSDQEFAICQRLDEAGYGIGYR